MQTKTIAGHPLTLHPGVRYIATRPMAQTGVIEYPVSIYETPVSFAAEPVAVVGGLDYDGANALLAEFNNWATSFDGRAW